MNEKLPWWNSYLNQNLTLWLPWYIMDLILIFWQRNAFETINSQSGGKEYANAVMTKWNPRIYMTLTLLTHWGRVTHICVSKLTIIGSDNGLSPERHQAIIWTNAGKLLIGPFWTNFSEISIGILIFSFKKMRLKVSSAKRRPFCLGPNVGWYLIRHRNTNSWAIIDNCLFNYNPQGQVIITWVTTGNYLGL